MLPTCQQDGSAHLGPEGPSKIHDAADPGGQEGQPLQVRPRDPLKEGLPFASLEHLLQLSGCLISCASDEELHLAPHWGQALSPQAPNLPLALRQDALLCPPLLAAEQERNTWEALCPLVSGEEAAGAPLLERLSPASGGSPAHPGGIRGPVALSSPCPDLRLPWTPGGSSVWALE